MSGCGSIPLPLALQGIQGGQEGDVQVHGIGPDKLLAVLLQDRLQNTVMLLVGAFPRPLCAPYAVVKAIAVHISEHRL